MYRILTLILVVLFITNSKAQETESSGPEMQLTLNEAIQLAKLQSLYSFRYKNMYLASYWDFRSYKASQLPGLRLNTTPINYDRSVTQLVDPNTGENKFVFNEYVSSQVGLSLSQNVTFTGGQLSLSSNVRRLQDIEYDNTSYTSVPISIRLTQPLNGYNEFKWLSKLKPLEYEQAKKTYLTNMEALSQRAVNVFFNSVSAEIDLKIAETNLANADTLFNIGKGRFNIGTVTQDELLDLELSYLNAKMAKTKAQVSLKQARNLLNSFLGFDKDVVIQPIIPNEIPELKVEADEVLDLAKENNPQILELEATLINRRQNLAEKKATSGLSASLSANVGVNRQAYNLEDVYKTPYGDDRGLGISLYAPILDWGTRKGQIQMAKFELKRSEAEVDQALIDFEQEVVMQAIEFNLQEEQVNISAKADTVAQLGFNVTKQRFMIDKVDVIKLNAARSSYDQAKRSYISSLSQYWQMYFRIRELTLYDFEKKELLIKDLDYLLEN
ncbi:TolC family protein [Carboxylicivirga caseinilyticus]|uniref:TolC family protein n=1 Tax=Carboxylicivirga caseinilyticus TaxID=3417572 RepID=UPI003D345586|nr:TolC family protein [Marinilabiliaceae bacterium A049]